MLLSTIGFVTSIDLVGSQFGVVPFVGLASVVDCRVPSLDVISSCEIRSATHTHALRFKGQQKEMQVYKRQRCRTAYLFY